MPTAKHIEMERMWELLFLLPSESPGKTVEQLRQALADEEIEVSLRTVQRYLSKLEPRFGLIQQTGAELGKRYDFHKNSVLWHWPTRQRSRVELRGISIGEALALRLMELTVSTLLPRGIVDKLKPRFEIAARKLDSQRTLKGHAKWPDKIAAVPEQFRLTPPVVDPAILDEIQDALLNNSEIQIAYRKPRDKEPSDRTLHPRALVLVGSRTELVANWLDNSRGPDTPLHYRVDRIQSVRTTGRRTTPVKFDLKGHLASQPQLIGSGELVKLEFWACTDLADRLKETPLSGDQTAEDRKDGTLFTATIHNSLRFRQWLLGHHENIEVKKPAKLRKWMRETLAAALTRYQGK